MMLKILEKTWKEEEAKKPQSPVQEISQSTELTSSDNPSYEPYMDVLSSGTSRTKRSRASTDPTTSERPSKLLKTVDSDFLRDHLPEVVDSHDRDDNTMIILTAPTFKEQILEEAKHDNVIAVLPPTKSSANLLVQFLSWAVQEEKHRPGRSLMYSRTVLFVVDDVSILESYSSLFESGIPGISVGRSSTEIQAPSLEVWSDLLMNDIVMAPSDLLLTSLLHGVLTITQFHTMVISDAQNLKNQDSHISLPIVQVMNEFYRVTNSLSRPRIFALASSSPDRRSYFDSRMLKLEQTLDARVFGVTAEKRAEILALPDRPNELVVLYDTPQQISDTRLYKQLRSLDTNETAFRRHFRASRHAHEEVGSCASDLVWRRALKDIDASLLPWDADFDEDDQSPSSDRIKVRMRDIVKNWAFTMPNLDPSSRGFNVSHKFLRLVQVLITFSSYGEGFRGIIFVQRRAIALVLADLLRTADDRLGFLRPQAIVGGGQSADYQENFHNFTTGVYNLLIGTKAIEDLDVPKASVVIRYDLFESQISHAYVRARTRGRESHLVHMVERGNDVHRRILSRITNLDTAMLDWTETLCNFPESAVPPDSLRETINPYHSDSEDEDGDEVSTEHIKDPTTGGRIHLQDATTTLYRYAASARSKGLHISHNQRLFEFQDIRNGFELPRAHVCTIVLPGTPIDKVSGDPASSKAQARRLACFEACKFLFESGLLDFRLVPLPSALRAQKDNHLGNLPEKDSNIDPKTSGTRMYGRKRPDFWVNATQGDPTTLYPSVIFIKDTENSSEYSPIVILTRQPLPELQSFRLFSSGVDIPVQFYKATPLRVDEARLKDIHMYTVRICRAIMNKSLSCSLENMLYFFLPLSSNWRPPDQLGLHISDICDDVPWNLVSLAADHWAVPINKNSPEQLELDLKDAIIQDRWIEFTRRYKVVKVRHDLTPLSKPADSPREARYENLFDFCKSKRKGLDSLDNFEQPIIEVSKVPPIMNHLNPTSKLPYNPSKSPAKYLIPELCAKFTLPASILRTAMFLPSIMRRIDDFLIVKELNAKFFDHAVKEDLLHIAICTPSAALEYDYERLELLGDAFLKYLSSVYVFVTNPSLSEGSLHISRQKIISNKSLLQNATRIGMPAYIQSKAFAFKSWQPPNFQVCIPPKTQKDPESRTDNMDMCNNDESGILDADLDASQALDEFPNEAEDTVPDPQAVVLLEPGELVDTISDNVPVSPVVVPLGGEQTQPTSETKGLVSKKKHKSKKKKTGSDERTVQWLGDKAIADVAEAIIGAAYISGGREAALQVTKALTIPLSNVDRWSDFGRKVLTPSPDISAKLRVGSISAIEDIIGHKFHRPHLLVQAMTHSSIQGHESTSYERLEFIGDAILDFMVIRHIFDRDQKLSPGALTMLKGAMVSNSSLAAICVWSGLHEFLLFESSQLSISIQAYAIELKDRQTKEYVLAEQEGRLSGQYWLDIEPPKVLSDLLESIIGAIYISDNFSPIGAESLFDKVLKPFYDKHITLGTLSHHPTKILFELFQAQGCQQFGITRDRNNGLTRCHVMVHEVILASGEDTTHTFAARLAALFALDALEGDVDFMTRTCDCRTHIIHKKARKKSAFEQALENALKDGEMDVNSDGNDDEMEMEMETPEGTPGLFGGGFSPKREVD